MVRTKSFSLPFSVADTLAGPKVEWELFALTLRFTDYLKVNREIRFEEVPHFELVSEDELITKQFRYDGVVEIIDSPLISKLMQVGEICPDDNDYRHIVIGFNEVGSFLVIVFKSFACTNS